jgi:uncharacterized membrane protein
LQEACSTVQRIERSIRVKAPVEQAYTYWRSFDNFPEFMEHVEEARSADAPGQQSHWKLKGPLGSSVEFDAEITKDEPNKLIAWNSSGGSLGTSGTVTFTQMADNTQVHVVMQWADPPAGALGEAASKVLQNPAKMLEEDLQRFKDIAEGRLGSGLRR